MNSRIWSLLDMFELPFGDLVASINRLSGLFQSAQFAVNLQKKFQLPEDQHDWTRKDILKLRDCCAAIGLVTAGALAERVLTTYDAATSDNGFRGFDISSVLFLTQELHSLFAVIHSEASTKIALVIPNDKAHLYIGNAPLFGAEVNDRFRSAIYDIKEAAKCLALGRSTACVYHLMRVVERALRAVHQCLGLPIPNNPSWGIWLKQIRDDRVRRGDRQWSENDYFQDVYSRLDAIKDAQRDPTMHVESIHTEEEAARIFEDTKAFMKKIASRMDENGEPKA